MNNSVILKNGDCVAAKFNVVKWKDKEECFLDLCVPWHWASDQTINRYWSIAI